MAPLGWLSYLYLLVCVACHMLPLMLQDKFSCEAIDCGQLLSTQGCWGAPSLRIVSGLVLGGIMHRIMYLSYCCRLVSVWDVHSLVGVMSVVVPPHPAIISF